MDVMGKEGFAPNVFTCNSLVNGLCKKQRFWEAYELLKKGVENGLHSNV